MEFPKTVMPHSDNRCTTASNLSPEYLQLEKALHENCFEIPLQSTGSQSDGFDISGNTNFVNSDWYGHNLETSSCGGAWEFDDIEEQLERFASQEMNDVATKLLQNSKEFESAAFKVKGQTSSSAYDVFNPSSVDVVNSFENGGLSHSVTDCYSSNSVSGRIAVQSQMSQPCQAQSVKSYNDQPPNCLTGNICSQFGAKENLEHLQNVATGSGNANVNSVSNIPAKKHSSVEVDHCYCDCVSDNARQNLRGGIDPILEQDLADCNDLPVFCYADEADFMLKNGHDHQDELFPPLVVASDSVIIEQCYIENSVDFNPCNTDIIISDLSKEKNILFEPFHSSATAVDIMALLPNVNERWDSNLTRNSSVLKDQMPDHRNDVITDSPNCNSSSVQAEGGENLSQNSTIADPHFVGPSMLLQSSNHVAKDCLPIIYCPEDVTEQLSENLRENETLKRVGAGDRPTDDDMPDLRIDDVVKSIKKENPFMFDDKTDAEGGVWKDPDPYGLKECYCPHGYVSSDAGHFHCQECGNSVRHKSSMICHEIEQHRIRHPNIKVFSCPYCSACFMHSSRLQRHILKHSNLAQCDKKDDNAIILRDFEHQKSDSRLLSTTANSGCDDRSRSLAPDIKNVQEILRSSKLLKRKSAERSSNFKKIKPTVTSDDKLDGSSISLPKEYSLITLIDEKMSTTCHPAYDGPLLPVLLTPTKICKFCGQRFSRKGVQLHHYAQVHLFCIGGITVYECALCKFRAIRQSDMSKHVNTEKHRSAVGNKSEHNVASGEAPLTDDATQSIRYDIRKMKHGHPNFKSIVKGKYIPKPSQSYGDCRSNDRKMSIENYSKSCLVVKTSTDLELNAGISKYPSNRKISQFFSLMKRDKETVESTDKFTVSLSSKIVELNACVSGHSCTLHCICSSNMMQGDVSSNVKMQCRNQSKVSSGPVKSNETEQRSVLTSFGNKGIHQQQDDRPNSHTISTKPRPITFFQDTTKRFQTPTLAKCSNPTSAKEAAVPLKSRLPLALKRTSCRRRPCLTANKDSCNQTLDNGSGSSNVPAVKTGTLDTVGQFKAGPKQIMSRSSRDLLDSSPGNQMVGGKACGRKDVILLDDDFVAKDQSQSTVHVSSKSDDVDGTCLNKGASLSGFSDEELFSELKKRSCLTLCCCGVYFLDSTVYNLHFAWHSEEGSLKCNFCGLNSKNWYEFYSHILNHSK